MNMKGTADLAGASQGNGAAASPGPHAAQAPNELHDALAVIFQQVRRTLFELPNRAFSPATSGDHFDITNLPGRVRDGLPADHPPPRLCDAILSGCDKLLADASRNSLDGASFEVEDRMENLAGAWLGLYFLGMPFIHPWEPVAHHAERNGYYRGAGICKATGDVYRDARKSLRNERPRGSAEKEAVLVLDHNPLAIRHLVASPEPAPRVFIAALGACYELLQLRLYVRAGGPIRHLVFDTTVAHRLAQDGGGMSRREDKPAQAAVDALWAMAAQCYEIGGPARRQLDQDRLTVIKPQSDIARMPACVLSPSKGVFRSQIRLKDDAAASAPAVHYGANGNRLPDAQHSLFRTVLLARKPLATDFVVTSATKPEFEAFCQNPLGSVPVGVERRRNRADPPPIQPPSPPTAPSVH